jgi:hypothetical protein
MKPSGYTAVMADRGTSTDSLDYFPTPPWATRALITYVLPAIDANLDYSMCWEPAAGSGHMAEPLREFFGAVFASDVYDYGRGYAVGSFVGVGSDVSVCPFQPDWVVTNPPFKLGEEFVRRGLTVARYGVAMLARTAFIESAARYPIFSPERFAVFAPFAGRVPMVKGRWDPAASSATSYSWFVWTKRTRRTPTITLIIPPTAKIQCTKQTDVARFGTPSTDSVPSHVRRQ